MVAYIRFVTLDEKSLSPSDSLREVSAASMSMSMSTDAPQAPAGDWEPTSWTTVLEARADDEDTRRNALERLMRRYLRPIELEIRRRRRCSDDELHDLTQSLLFYLIKRDFLKDVSPEKGRFRTFVRVCIRHFLVDDAKRRLAEKRGSGLEPRSLQETDLDGNPMLDPADTGATPDQAFDLAWALRVVEVTLERLRRERAARGKLPAFEALKGTLVSGGDGERYAVIAERLGVSEGAVKKMAFDLRDRWQRLLREEVEGTVGSAADWRDELRYLIDLLARAGTLGRASGNCPAATA